MTSSNPNYLVIGLSGVTNGGKTTLAAKLAAHFGPGTVELRHLDDYFITDTSRLDYVPELNHWNFEQMHSLEWDRYYSDVRAVIDRFDSSCSSGPPKLLILDGFLLFNEPRLLSLCHLKYDFTLPYAVAKERRATRVYEPPDVPGYFEKIAWPAYLKHKEEIETLKKREVIETVDGTEDAEIIFARVLRDIENALKR